MIHQETFGRVEKQLEYSLYLMLTVCLLTLYTGVALHQKRQPVREVNELRNYIKWHQASSSRVLLITRPGETGVFVQALKRRLDSTIRAQLGFTPSWGGATANSLVHKWPFP